jgi:FkbM family methyltransferase
VPDGSSRSGGLAASLAHSLASLYRSHGTRGAGRLIRAAASWFPGLQCLPAETVDGRILHLDLRDETCLTYFLFGQIPTDRWETELVRRVVLRGEAAVDVGAFVGWYSTLLADVVGPGGAVYAFEPNPVSHALLALSARRYPWLQAMNAAVGAQAGTSPLYVPRHLHSSSLRPTGSNDDLATCDVVSLDSFLAAPGRHPPVFVKCDAEGAEVAILEGAAGFLRRHAAIWLIEICADTVARFGSDVGQLVERFDSGVAEKYQAFWIQYPTGALRPIEERPPLGIHNAVFVPSSLGARLEAYGVRQSAGAVA